MFVIVSRFILVLFFALQVYLAIKKNNRTVFIMPGFFLLISLISFFTAMGANIDIKFLLITLIATNVPTLIFLLPVIICKIVKKNIKQKK